MPRQHLPTGVADLPPGVDLAQALAGVDLSRLNGHDLIEVAPAVVKMISHYQAQLAQLVDQVDHCPPGHGDSAARRIGHTNQWAQIDIAARLSRLAERGESPIVRAKGKVGRVSDRKTRVAVVFGGRSTEHAISCVSAGSVLGALDPDEFEVVPVGITRAGRWVLTSGDRRGLAIQGRQLPEVTDGSGSAVVLPADPTGSGLLVVDPADGVRALDEVDVVFPVLHGAYGEDGTLQGLLEMAGIPYVGAGVFASAAAMDKEFTKQLTTAAGIPTGPYAVLRAGASLEPTDRERLGLPVFVKPARAGSSYGITKVHDWDELDAALAAAREIDPKVLVEAAVVGREIECGVLEGEHGGDPEASLLAEVRVVTGHEFYDFEAKYLDDSCEFDIPADLPEHVTNQVQEYAKQTFIALDCAGLARVDFFVTPQLEVYLNEINTMPGFTASSMFPRMWAETGLPYPKLVARLVRTALRRGTGLR